MVLDEPKAARTSRITRLQEGRSHNKGRDQLKKKNVFFRALPELPNHPPPDPNLGNLVLFFGRQKWRFARMTEIFFDYDNDGFNDNYDDNFGNFDDNYDKND